MEQQHQMKMNSVHHLLTLNYVPPPPPPSSLPYFLIVDRRWPITTTTTTTYLYRNPNLASSLPPTTTSSVLRHVCVHCRRPNAETFQSQNFNSRPHKDEDDYEEFMRWSKAADQLIDDIWVFKVFKSYGWMLPGIILSFLLATGPKAFLMTLALPFGLSVVSFALESIWSRKRKDNQKVKARKKPPRPYARTSSKFESEEEERHEGIQSGMKGKIDYESWVAANSVPANNISKDKPTFGGWDELDKGAKFDMGTRSKSVDETGRNRKNKMSKRETKGDIRLLLRLMVAVFPFLGSWIKML